MALRLPLSPDTADEVLVGERAIRLEFSRKLLIAGGATVLCAALVLPSGRPVLPALDSTPVPQLRRQDMPGTFMTVDKVDKPWCYWRGGERCRIWRINDEPFPQAAPYLKGLAGGVRQAPR